MRYKSSTIFHMVLNRNRINENEQRIVLKYYQQNVYKSYVFNTYV